jgi:large subunit ribosomal protein L18
MKPREKLRARVRRHRRVRAKVTGAPGRPRLSVYRSNRHIYVQVIDDVAGRTLASASSLADPVEGDPKEVAKAVGLAVAARAREAGIHQVVFDRGGFQFHGRVAALAEGAREGGLSF